MNRNTKIFLILFLIDISFTGLMQLVLALFNIHLHNPIEKTPLVEQVIVGIIVAPLIETWICQYLIFWVIKKFITNERNVAITFMVTSTVLFASQHNYSIYYILVMIFPGAMLSYCFLFYYKTSNSLAIAYWCTVLFHALHNLMAFVSDFM